MLSSFALAWRGDGALHTACPAAQYECNAQALGHARNTNGGPRARASPSRDAPPEAFEQQLHRYERPHCRACGSCARKRDTRSPPATNRQSPQPTSQPTSQPANHQRTTTQPTSQPANNQPTASQQPEQPEQSDKRTSKPNLVCRVAGSGISGCFGIHASLLAVSQNELLGVLQDEVRLGGIRAPR